MTAETESLRREVDELRQQVEIYKNSRSWRITRPLRIFSKIIGRFKDNFKRSSKNEPLTSREIVKDQSSSKVLEKSMLKTVYTLIPGGDPIELPFYYPFFANYYPECELQTKRWVVENVKSDWVVFDCGANIGYYSILFSRMAQNGVVYAFEPTETIHLLESNLKHNNCFNVMTFEVALSANAGCYEENIFRLWGSDPERRPYNFSTVDKMVEKLRLERLDCIKIDVDSFDFEVLRGAEESLKRFNPWVIVELNHALSIRNTTVSIVLEWLYSRGYRDALVLDNENFLFRRDTDVVRAQSSSLSSFNLMFETRPIIMPPSTSKGEILDAVFAVHPEVHNLSVLERKRNGWWISVPGPCWSYAATWPKMRHDFEGPAIIEVVIEVHGGMIGVGCLAEDHCSFIGKEQLVKELPMKQTVSILTDRIEDIECLVLRNTDSSNMASDVCVYEIRTYEGISVKLQTSTLLSPLRHHLTVKECVAALEGREIIPVDEDDEKLLIDIVPIETLGAALNFEQAFVPEVKIYRQGLPDFKTEIHEAPFFSYIYRNFKPRRHLEFGTREGFGSVLCAKSCAAEIWTVNLPEDESDSNGLPIFASTVYDSKSILNDSNVRSALPNRVIGEVESNIGWIIQKEGFSDRVHQILCDSRNLDVSQFGAGFFDTVLIDGGHTKDIVISDTNNALYLLRSGGIVIWHDFCPDVETLKLNQAPRGVLEAVIENFTLWRPSLSKIFWIRPSWILIGVKR